MERANRRNIAEASVGKLAKSIAGIYPVDLTRGDKKDGKIKSGGSKRTAK